MRDLSLRQFPFANCGRPRFQAQIPFVFKGSWPDQPNLRDWRRGDFQSLNGFCLFLSEPRPIWFGRRKPQFFSSLTFHADRTFYGGLAAWHAIRDTISERGATRRCARVRVPFPVSPSFPGWTANANRRRRGQRPVYVKTWFACSDHGNSAAAIRSMIDMAGGLRVRTSVSRTLGAR